MNRAWFYNSLGYWLSPDPIVARDLKWLVLPTLRDWGVFSSTIN